MVLHGDFDKPYAEEEALDRLFNGVAASFMRLGRGMEASREQNELSEVTKKLSEAKM